MLGSSGRSVTPYDESLSEPHSVNSGSSLPGIAAAGGPSPPSTAAVGGLSAAAAAAGGGPSAPTAVAEGEVIVNREALEQTQNLSQRCSAEAIGEYKLG